MEHTLHVNADSNGERLDKFIAASLPLLSRTFIQSIITDGFVRVDARVRKSNFHVTDGAVVQIEIPPALPTAVQPEPLPLDILFEDDALLVINKPAGLVVHPSAGHQSGTLVNAVLAHAPDIVIGSAERPGIVHRLDRDTSGVMLIAKTDRALKNLQQQFEARTVHKTYLALVRGKPAVPQGKIDAPIARNRLDRQRMSVSTKPGARDSVTVFHVLASNSEYSFLQVEPRTGRTHQIRVHLAYIKHPVVGDETYAKKSAKDLGLDRQFLHAWRIEFNHPASSRPMSFAAPLPPDLRVALSRAGFSVNSIPDYNTNNKTPE